MGRIGYWLKYYWARMLHSAGIVDRKIQAIPSDRFFVLMYHRIIPAKMADETVQPGMYVLPETFDQHLRFLSVRFEMESLQTLSSAEVKRCKKPRCIVTFDDGWRDFYDFAFPILRKYQVPATVFLPTGFIGSNCTFWTDRLAQLLKKIESSSTGKAVGSNRSEDPLVDRILCNQSNFPERIEYSIKLLKGEVEERIEKVLCELALLAGGFSRSERRFLTWKEVREAQASDLIDFGSHTVRHQILTHLDSGEIQTELNESRQKLIQEKVVHSEFIPFCYPNGNYSVKIKELVQDAGYSTACTTRYGINFPQGDRFALKRVGIHQDMSAHEGLLGCRLLGIC